MSRVGYTKRQADTLNRRIELEAGRACDAIARMAELVPDHRANHANVQQLVLELEDELQRVVNRRRRPAPAPPARASWQDPTGRI
jgi:hypothetical protein